MVIKELNSCEVKKIINDHKVEFREFFTNRTVYGAKNKSGNVIGMVAVSNNKHLNNTKKLFTPFIDSKSVDQASDFIKSVVDKINKSNQRTIIYCDVLADYIPFFESAGFTFTSVQNGLKRYNKLYRAIYKQNKVKED